MNPESLKSLLERYRATGRLAFYHPRKGTISLNGGKHIPVKDAVKVMRETLERTKNPADDAALFYESFHGAPSKEVVEIEEEEFYHGHLAELGVLIELQIVTVNGDKAVLTFDVGDDRKSNPEGDLPKKYAGWSGKQWTGRKSNPSDHVDTDTVLLCSNESGTQLFIMGGDQSLNLGDLKLDEVEKELVVVGDVSHIVYRTSKDFDNHEETDYIHAFSEDSGGPLPELIYDAKNEKFKLAGGCYNITRPLVGTSPGIED